MTGFNQSIAILFVMVAGAYLLGFSVCRWWFFVVRLWCFAW